jgi:hemoglobin/transferrin/lactoferrin receptor protein
MAVRWGRLAWLGGASMMAMAVVMGAASVPARAEAARVAVDMPTQALGQALETLAGQSHIQLLYSADLVRGLTAPALKGDLTADEALRKLLSGTGLEARGTGDGKYSIGRATATATTRLDPVTVVATRTENKAFELPASVSVVTRDQIDDKQAKDISTIVRDLPGVTMGGTPREGGQLPTIRGYQGPDIIVRVDDARRSLDTSVGLFTPLYLDPNFVKRVEVVRGPSSAAYGGGGVGGVMAFRTIDPSDVLATGQDIGGRLKAGYRTGDGSITTNATAAAQGEGASVLAGGTFRNYHNVNTGTGSAENTQNGTTENGLFKLGYAPNDLNAFQASYMRYFDAGFGPTNPASNDTATTGYKYVERSQDEFTGRWEFHDSGKEWFDGKVVAYATNLKYDGQRRTTSTTDSTFDVDTVGGTAQNSTRFATSDLKHRLTYGIDGYQDQLTNTSAGGLANVNPNGTLVALGGFLQDEVQLTDDWTLIPTLRYDRYEAVGGSSSETNSANRMSPKLAVKWQALPALGLFASYGEAFRAPTLTELYWNSSTGVFQWFRANPALKPQVSRTKEIGGTLSFNDLMLQKDSFRFKVNVFDEKVRDFIYSNVVAYNGTTPINQYENVGRAHRWGGEIETSYRAGDWELGLGYSRVRVDYNYLLSPPDKLTANLGYYFDEYLSFRYAGRFVAAQDYDDNVSTTNDRRRSGYAVHDIGASYDRDWYRVDFGITNLFDKAYSTYQQSLITSKVYEEGRSVNLTGTVRF